MDIAYRAGWIKKILTIAQTMPHVCPDMCIAHNGYAEPGYEALEGAPVILANWNGHARGATKADLTMPRLVDIFEHFGAEIEWCDEWAICECGKRMTRTGRPFFGPTSKNASAFLPAWSNCSRKNRAKSRKATIRILRAPLNSFSTRG